MVELMVSIATLGILSAIAIPIYSGTHTNATTQATTTTLDWLNDAVVLHNLTSGLVLANAADGTSGGDEAGVISELIKEKPAGSAAVVGYPFLRPTPVVVETDDINLARYNWDGEFFTVLRPGTSGTGIIFGKRGNPDAIPLTD